MRERVFRTGPALRAGFLVLAAVLTATALFAVPPAKGPPAVTLGVLAALTGALLGTAFATFIRRIDPAPRKLQQRRSIAILAAGVLIATSAAFLVNASRLTDTGIGVELPILAVAADGKVTTLDPDMATNLPMIVKPRTGRPPRLGGCLWLAKKRGLFGAGLFDVAETHACSPVRGISRASRPPGIAVPAGGQKTDWRWAS